MKNILIVCTLCCLSLTAGAQETKEKKPWLKNSIQWAGQKLDEMAISNVDTNYLQLPKYGWRATVSGTFAGIGLHLRGDDMDLGGNVRSDIQSHMNGNVAIGFGYRGLYGKFSFDVAKGYSHDVHLAAIGKLGGIEYRHHVTKSMYGDLKSGGSLFSEPQTLHITKGDIRMRADIINGYYVFNHRHFSLASALNQSLIQRRSAGSFIGYAMALSASMRGETNKLGSMMDYLKELELNQVAVGLGYGYNFTPNHGKLLIHASAAPLLVFHNSNLVTLGLPMGLFVNEEDLEDMTEEEQQAMLSETLDWSQKIEPRHKIFLTGAARASVSYALNDHLYCAGAALINQIRFQADGGFRVRMNDWIATATVGYRF